MSSVLAAGYNLTSGQMEILSKILFDDATGDIAAQGALAAGTFVQLKDYGGSSPSPSIGGALWAEKPGSSDEIWFYDGTGAAKTQLLDTNYSLVGDVSGLVGATVVGKIQGDQVYASISPTDGQVLTWDNSNSRWDAATPSSGVTTLAALTDTDISSPAGGELLLWDGSNSWDNKALSGDATITTSGVISVADLTMSGEVTNDLVQYSGAAWVSKGGGSGDRLGTLYGTSADLNTQLQVGTYITLQTNRIRLGDLGGSAPIGGTDGDIYYDNNGLRLIDNSSTYTVAHSGTALAGDVTGTLGVTVVGNDSHTHSNDTLTGVPGTGIDTNVTNLRGSTVENVSPAADDKLVHTGSGWNVEKTSRVRVYLNENQGADGSFTILGFDSETYDTRSEFASERFTAIDAGYYYVMCEMYFDGMDAGEWTEFQIRKNGTAVTQSKYVAASSSNNGSAVIADIVQLNVSQYIEIFARNTAPGDYVGGALYTHLCIHKII